MQLILNIVHIFLSLIIIVLIFLQATGENEGKSNLLATPSEKRGWDKIVYNFTFVAIFLFLISAVVQTLLL